MKIVVIGRDIFESEPINALPAELKFEPVWIDLSGLQYWLDRMPGHPELLGPGDPNTLVRFVDYRDLKDELAEQVKAGDSKEIGMAPRGMLVTVQDIVELIRGISESNATFTWVSDRFLKSQGLTGTEIPFWLEQSDEAETGEEIVRPDSSVLLRSVESTLRECSNALVNVPQTTQPNQLLSAEQEYELLRHWHQLSVPYRSEAMELG